MGTPLRRERYVFVDPVAFRLFCPEATTRTLKLVKYLTSRDFAFSATEEGPNAGRRSGLAFGSDRCSATGNCRTREIPMSLGTILLIILILILVGALPTWPYSSGWGYYPSGGIGLVLIILLILVLMGRL
jgi:uncharacterized protein DUF3309